MGLYLHGFLAGVAVFEARVVFYARLLKNYSQVHQQEKRGGHGDHPFPQDCEESSRLVGDLSSHALRLSACLWLEKWGQTSYARESLVDPFSRFLYQPLRGFSGVCRLERHASMNA